MTKRHPALLTKSCIFVLVDVQEKLFPYVEEKEKVLKNTVMLLKFAKIMNIPVVVTEHYPKGLGETVPELKTLIPDFKPIVKTCFSCCLNDEFVSALERHGSKTLVVFGIESHICIEQTALDAKAMGYDVHVVIDAISARSRFNEEIGADKMRQFGIVITTTEAVLYEIMENKDIKEFKEILPLLKG